MARQVADAHASFAGAGQISAEVAGSLVRTGRLTLLGMGASHAVNRAVEPLYRAFGIDAQALPVSEQLGAGVPLAGKTVLVASQSGESAEVLRWLQTGRGGEAFGMTLDPASTLAGALPSLVAAGGVEVAFAATRSLTLTFALHLAVLARLGTDPAPALAALALPVPDVGAGARRLEGVAAIVASGRRLQGVAEAAALGLCELARLPAFALDGGQLRHGPMEMMGPDLGVVLFRSAEADSDKVAAMAASAADTGAKVVLFDTSGAGGVAGVESVILPTAGGMEAILSILPAMQRLMLDFAAARVSDVGTPRRSAKITRVE